MLHSLLGIGLASVVIVVLTLTSRRRCLLRRFPLPPGPSPLPFIGNVRDIPPSHEWITYAKWAKTYGDVMHISVFGKSLVLLSSLDAAKDLLEKRSAVTSDRPHFAMISDLMGWTWAVQFMDMGLRFRKYRKTLQQLLHPHAVREHHDMMHRETRLLLRDLLRRPEGFDHHLRHHTGGLMMSILYGVDEGPLRDQYIAMAEDAVGGLVEAGNIGNFLVDFLPLLKHVPEWMPGASFQKKARVWRQMARDMIEIPYRNVQRSYDRGCAASCVTTSLISQQQQLTEGDKDAELIKGIAGVLYVGGADTALSALFTFMLAMVLHPEKQKRAQAEIDATVGRERLPNFSDRPLLQYIECVLLEVLRWHPGVPLGVPHRCMEDLEYRGYRIPAGATILVNQWAILHDEQHYSDPFAFNPDRFCVRDDVSTPLHPAEASFGHGRRICPGRHFANDVLWLMMVNILAAFNISKCIDAEGNDLEPHVAFTNGLVTRPESFACSITPRSASVARILDAME
ncbi:cytochrome P450 [Obba rivulosa]|uniref:Cytochrome P450 n=1 Tax=Obba rivulosa TaxID=1052685 RepID=A0A8E2B6C1_9APHY|nr:cytochrome P450 [Obba rivulosa]